MQQSWYLFPGQTLENTKVSDRGRALIATPAQWSKFSEDLIEKEDQQKKKEKELARRQYYKETSYNMVKNWENSVERIHERRMAEFEIKVKAREEALVNRFMELTKAQADERAEIVRKARKHMYMTSEKSQQLNSALILSEVLYERKLQQELSAEERERQRIEEEKYAQQIMRNVEQYHTDIAETKRKKKETVHNYITALKHQIKEIQEKSKKEQEEQLKEEIIDRRATCEESKALEEETRNLEIKVKASIKKQFVEFDTQQKQIREYQKERDEREDRIINICAKAKDRLEQMKKSKLESFEQERQRIRDKISSNVIAKAQSYEKEEARVLAKAIKEHDARANKRIKKAEAYKKRLRDELAEYNRKRLIRKQKEKEDKQEMKKWDMANRLKVSELLVTYNKDTAQRLFNEKIQYRKDLHKQTFELQNRAKYEAELEAVDFQRSKDKFTSENNAFFAYANEVIDLAKSRRRCLRPILKVVQKYKVDNGLIPKKTNPSTLNFKGSVNSK